MYQLLVNAKDILTQFDVYKLLGGWCGVFANEMSKQLDSNILLEILWFNGL